MRLSIKRNGFLFATVILLSLFINHHIPLQKSVRANEHNNLAALPLYRTYIPFVVHDNAASEPAVAAPQKGIAATFAYKYEDGHTPFNVSWFYTWSLYPGKWANSGLEFVPMWPCGGSVDYVVEELGADYSGYLLFHNEPDVADQCNMSIDTAALSYIEIRNALPQAKLIGPQTITPKSGDFAGWTDAWRNRVHALTGRFPDIAGYGVHIYPKFLGDHSPNEVIADYCAALRAWEQSESHELWVTEFGVDNFDGTPEAVASTVTNLVDLFENPPSGCTINRYAYFTDRRVAKDPNSTDPIIEPGGPHYFDLFWRNSDTLSYVGTAFQAAIAGDG